jgi:hypothetical protein
VNVADDPDSFLIKIAALRITRRRQSGTNDILISNTDLSAQAVTFLNATENR